MLLKKHKIIKVARENMAKTDKRAKGDTGEGVAAKYLENKGYLIVERNYWKPWGEIDIVAKKGLNLCFVEVKTVTREPHTEKSIHIRPEENFHPAKLKRLHRAIQTYLMDHKIGEETPWQIVLACVYLDFSTRRAKVELFENLIL
jgi:putative endonuclease